MKKSTKLLIVLAVALLIANIFLAKYLVMAIQPTGDGFAFNFDALAWTALAFMVAFNIVFFILFFRFLKTLKLSNVIFFSIAPLTLIYGVFLVYLTAVKSLSGTMAESVRALMNIQTTDTSYNNYLWAIIATLIYLLLIFFIIWLACKPLAKVEKITDKLGDGRLKNDNFKLGGGKQFKEIEHSLNKINFNYQQKDNKIKQTDFQQKGNSKLFGKFIGKSGVDELVLGNQVKKTATTMLCQIVSKNETKRLSLEENFTYINSYLKVVAPLIKRYDGYVDKFLGDGLFAVFVKPRDAIECSHALLRAIEVKNKSLKDKTALQMRISLNTDEVTFAIVGDEKIPTVISNQYDLAVKMEEINNFIGSKFLISKNTISSLPASYDFDYRYTGDLSLANNQKLALYESLSYYPKSKREKIKKMKNKFEEGVRSYNLGKYDRAKSCFAEVLHHIPDDEVSYVYFNKASEKISQPA